MKLTPLVLLLLTFVALSSWGCRSLPDSRQNAQLRCDLLSRNLLEMSSHVDPTEAQKLSHVAVEESDRLRRQYSAIRPPWIHNVMVNHGFRERGLCFHWTNDLFLQLLALQSASLDLYLAVALMDTRNEHNAIVVTASGQPFESGLVLDAWRRSGKLWFGPVSTDKYQWVPLPPDRFDAEIKKRLAEIPRPIETFF